MDLYGFMWMNMYIFLCGFIK